MEVERKTRQIVILVDSQLVVVVSCGIGNFDDSATIHISFIAIKIIVVFRKVLHVRHMISSIDRRDMGGTTHTTVHHA